MIGRIAGRIDYRASDHVLIDVRGIGYLVYCSERTLAALPAVGEHAALYTDLLVREDLLQLFGFTSLVEKEWHRLLMSVQGVGAKASMAILGTLGPEGVGRAIALGDAASVKAAKGIGPKTAQRVVIELKDKVPDVMAISVTPAPQAVQDENSEVIELIAPAAPTPLSEGGAATSDALSALTNLGYAPGDAAAAIAQASADMPDADSATLIRAALKLLAPKS
ncbi:MAG: Holliday junction branch migration protein RuvA [Pseudomonadota bacterium]